MTDGKTLLLYGVGSPNVVKVGIILEELSLPYELRYVGVFKGKQFDPEFLAINPLGKVPALVDPALGHPLFESGAILFYLAERHKKFLPADGAQRYEVMQWVMVQMANIGPMFGQLSHFRSIRKGADPYSQARYAELSRELYQLLDDRLGAQTWIAGGAYSIADMAIYPWALYLEKHGFSGDEFPALIRWRDTIAARPAVVRANSRFQDAFTENAGVDRRSATESDIDRLFRRTESAPPIDYSRIKG